MKIRPPPNYPLSFKAFLPLALFVVLTACSSGPARDWPWLGRGSEAALPADRPPARPETKTTGNDLAPGARQDRALAVRIRDESDRETIRLVAFVNEALSQHGFRPDATASSVLVIRFDRPRTMSAGSRPGVGIYGRGGSSGASDLGLSIEIPLGRGPPPPPPARHEIIAELEAGAGNVIWKERAAMDAPTSAELDASVARELIGRIVVRLARESERQEGKVRKGY